MFNRAIISFLLLLAGALIYATCRQDAMLLMSANPELVAKINVEVDYTNCNLFMYIILFCLPDALWYMALLIFQLELCSGGLLAKIVFGASIALPFVLEVLQRYGVMPGTFDWYDILTYSIILMIFILCQRKQFCRFWC